MIALFISIVALWFTELVPLAVTGILVPTLACCYGITDPKSAFAPFGNQILFLFIGAFFLGKAIQTYRLDKRVAYSILSTKLCSYSLNTLIAIFALICWFLSMWISNTATCVIMTPIALGISEIIGDNFSEEKSHKNFTICILLITAFASSIGGLATPIGTPPNVLAIEYLAELNQTISFLDWMKIGVPISLCMLVALLLILKLKLRFSKIDLSEIRLLFKQKLRELGKISGSEIAVSCCFLMAIVLWILPGVLAQCFPESQSILLINKTLTMGIVALIASIPLFLIPTRDGETILTWEQAQDIDWGTVLLFGGGLCLGNLLSETGLAATLGESMFSSTSSIATATAVAVLSGIILSEFSSNTAATAILVPIIAATFGTTGDSSIATLIIAAAFGASYGFMLPVSTPPNAIVYGTGKVPLGEMIKAGVIFDFTGFVIINLLLHLFL